MVQQHVEPLEGALAIQQGHLWAPTVGEELLGLLDRSGLDEKSQERIRSQAVAVLGHTLAPAEHGDARRTGLVFGYVQSGKTLSFTSVIALAHDNGIPLVILFSGTKRNLHQQTHRRLEHDLQARGRDDSPWLIFSNPRSSGEVLSEIATVLKSGRVGTSSNKLLQKLHLGQKTVVVTVMKNKTRLGNVRKLMDALAQSGIDLTRLPVLVVDDEADQAGLNARPGDEDDASATHAAIRSLRAAIPRHSYIEYTATPQAPLLVNLMDVLSPDFVGVLEPGDSYRGGTYFFGGGAPEFSKRVPTEEAQEAFDIGDGPPHTLKQALASYFVASLFMVHRDVKQSSMLVHPSHTMDMHDRFANWVRALRESWIEMLVEGGELRSELIKGYLRPAYDDLLTEQKAAPDFDTVVGALPDVLAMTQVRTVNSGGEDDARIDWEAFHFWILVGGNKLDRGYTVEGLVTTYMPRGAGGQQADTIQQRARFFGYKAAYSDLCRAWLVPTTAEIYERYVDHEESLRTELIQLVANGVDVKQWKRRIMIDPMLKPCRANVISLPYVRDRVRGDSWSRFERLGRTASRPEEPAALIDAFLGDLPLIRPRSRDPRDAGTNRVATLPLAEVLELLARWSCRSRTRAR